MAQPTVSIILSGGTEKYFYFIAQIFLHFAKFIGLYQLFFVTVNIFFRYPQKNIYIPFMYKVTLTL